MSAGTAARSVADRVVVVTGAASGMGRAIAELFAAEGARVAALDRTETLLHDVVRGIHDRGGRAEAYVLDVTHADAIPTTIRSVRAALGPVDVLVNDAGISIPAPIDGDGYDDAWTATMAVNLDGYVRMIRACLDDLARDGAGRIVNIASTEALGATAMMSPYTVSKHGVVGLTRALAVELGPRGVTVNCVCPGPIHTGMTALIPDDAKAKFARRRVPLRRYGLPEEVAHVVLSLALPAASFVTGAIVPVDGGLTALNT
ncbi:MAG TPA: SDR family NAD(P)-dependent oxidoreductase [Acidimicrobiia bacterium]|nr:SDR family NAD(P)-dependent oxidoreductase [Acidimicrobiia bacterium]